MRKRLSGRVERLTLAQRFGLASLVILVAGMLSIGWWVGREIEVGVINRTAATTALYVDSIVQPHVQTVTHGAGLGAQDQEELSRILRDTEIGQRIANFKLWDRQGRVLYSTQPGLAGQVFPVEQGLLRAWQGYVAAEISDMDDAENVLERAQGARMLEMYTPVRRSGADQIIAVAEFYHPIDELQDEVRAAQRRSWLVVAVATLLMYLLLAGFVQRASDMILRQQRALRTQVTTLTNLLRQNAELNQRVRQAAGRTSATNERMLRRISAELHDGPVQELALGLLRLDHVFAQAEAPGGQATAEAYHDDLEVVQQALHNALGEVRAISAGLGVPQLDTLNLADTVTRVVRAHERRTDTRVEVVLEQLPEFVSLPIKITVYRLIQEALTNAFRHADGVGQRVTVSGDDDSLRIAISDQGPGFSASPTPNEDEHLGLVGMRERVESLGGEFWVDTIAGQGTTIQADLPLRTTQEQAA